MAERLEPLLTWALAASHTALLTLLAVLLFHANGSLGGVLGALSTELGAAGYLALWAALWLVVRRSLAGIPFGAGGPRADTGTMANRAMFAGGILGSAVALLFLVANGLNAAARGAEGVGFALGFVVFLIIGAFVAFIVGALVAAALSALDAFLLGVARRLLGVPREDSPATTGG